MSRTDNQPDELQDDSPDIGPLTRAWLTACADDADALSPDAIESANMILTAEDLKQIKNTVISAISHNADVAAWFAAGMRAVLADAGVLTGAQFYQSDEVFSRLDQTIYGTVFKVLREAGLVK